MIHDGATLGAGLLIAVVFAKILVVSRSVGRGLRRWAVLVMLFIGGTAGMTAHVLIPGLPEGCVHSDVAALPGSIVAAPRSR